MKYRILSIDYGRKRTGLAVTDLLQKMAFGIATIKTNYLMHFLSSYIYEENIQKVVIGEPKNWNNKHFLIEKEIQSFISKFYLFFPKINIERIDERFTSKLSKKTLFFFKKKSKTNKFLLDKISATIILQSYIEKKYI